MSSDGLSISGVLSNKLLCRGIGGALLERYRPTLFQDLVLNDLAITTGRSEPLAGAGSTTFCIGIDPLVLSSSSSSPLVAEMLEYVADIRTVLIGIFSSFVAPRGYIVPH
jgi:hypothetical protein